MTHTSDTATRRPAENAPGQHQGGQSTPHQPAAPLRANDEPAPKEPTKGIPPLPEPDVEGVGEESGPSAGANTETLDPEQKKRAEDGTGF